MARIFNNMMMAEMCMCGMRMMMRAQKSGSPSSSAI